MIVEPDYRADRVQRGRGLLGVFNAAGVLSAADVHVALGLGTLGAESDEVVLLAAALTVRAVRVGSVCLEIGRMREVVVDDGAMTATGGDVETADLDHLPWPETAEVLAALRRSPLVAGGAAGPLRPLYLDERDDGVALLYLDRYYRQEQVVNDILRGRSGKRDDVDPDRLDRELDRLFPQPGDGRQREAARVAVTASTAILIGGPGTGKTYTIARILAALIRTSDHPLRVALAAPTGKAAARMQELVRQESANVELDEEFSAMTLHRLLGRKPGTSSRFEHDAANRLPHDVVVVDETSMVALTMMARLLEALRPDARLLLVGDPDQLTSVEAGAVLADLVSHRSEGPRPEIVRLTTLHRFGGRIATLADAVQAGDEQRVLEVLADGGGEVILEPRDRLDGIRAETVRAARAITAAAERGDAEQALSVLESHRVLCAHRTGPDGVAVWAHRVREWLDADGVDTRGRSPWYPGRPLLLTANDYRLGLYNGDTGVIVTGPNGAAMAAFPSTTKNGPARLFHPSALSDVQTAYTMTIHRSQGSQFEEVSVILPASGSALLTRELLYTAITRASKRVRLIGTPEALCTAVRRRVQRTSGLR